MKPAAIQLLFIAVPAVLSFPLSQTPVQQNNDGWLSYFNWENQGPGTYSFGYEIEDPKTGNVQFRHEEKYPNGTVRGKYGLVEPDGNVKVVHYTADEYGYRARVEDSLRGTVNLPSLETPLSSSQGGQGGYSPEYVSAVGATNTLGQNVQEQHTPPKYTDGQYYGNYYVNQPSSGQYYDYFFRSR
ncbi:cuticle protein 19-like [Cimex lectularius]|uniref:CPR type cuticle protein n=1 Tax=Cimex lectularius TaxID=79782 RepID=A0A8I6SFS5_CIMLE|nr:cuticle protein 19-like [Cimex lectularius]